MRRKLVGIPNAPKPGLMSKRLQILPAQQLPFFPCLFMDLLLRISNIEAKIAKLSATSSSPCVLELKYLSLESRRVDLGIYWRLAFLKRPTTLCSSLPWQFGQISCVWRGIFIAGIGLPPLPPPFKAFSFFLQPQDRNNENCKIDI